MLRIHEPLLHDRIGAEHHPAAGYAVGRNPVLSTTSSGRALIKITKDCSRADASARGPWHPSPFTTAGSVVVFLSRHWGMRIANAKNACVTTCGAKGEPKICP